MGQNGHLLISDLGLAFACPTHMSDLEKSLLTPFVLARREAHASEVTTGMCGTPLYTSPEMILRQPYSYAVDVWAFGVILFQMLIGGVSTSILIYLSKVDSQFYRNSVLSIIPLEEEGLPWTMPFFLGILICPMTNERSSTIRWQRTSSDLYVSFHGFSIPSHSSQNPGS